LEAADLAPGLDEFFAMIYVLRMTFCSKTKYNLCLDIEIENEGPDYCFATGLSQLFLVLIDKMNPTLRLSGDGIY